MRTKTGIVTSAKMDKTIVVTVHDYKTHPVYKKPFRTSKKYTAHDEKNLLKEGDSVCIQESRPLSKTKHWIVVENDNITSSAV